MNRNFLYASSYYFMLCVALFCIFKKLCIYLVLYLPRDELEDGFVATHNHAWFLFCFVLVLDKFSPPPRAKGYDKFSEKFSLFETGLM